MADVTNSSGSPLPPPKLDLRKNGVLKPPTPPAAPVPEQKPAPAEEVKSSGPVFVSKPVYTPPAVEEPAPATPPVAKQVPEAAADETAGTGSPAAETAEQVSDGTHGSQTTHIAIPGIAEAPTIARPAAKPLAVPAQAVQVKPAPPTGKRPAVKPVTVVAQPVLQAKPSTPKRDTSRIPLTAAAVPPSSDAAQSPVIAKTISVKPVVARPTVQPPQAAVAATPVKPGEEKRKTSRISLENAMANQPPSPGTEGPKTIRLKRPTEAPTIRSAPLGGPARAAGTPPAPGVTTPLTQTAVLPESSEDEEGPSPTRRKTIKVKRPDQRPTVEGGAPSIQMVAGPAVKTGDRPHWFFSMVAGITIILCGIVIYMEMAQATGPNYSLTQLSSAPDWEDLHWPGKLRMYNR